MSEASELYTYNLGKKNEEITKLKQERDELDALTGVMRDALMLYQSAGFGNSTEFRLQMDAYDAAVCALSITGPDALREIQARTLSHCAGYFRYLDENVPMTPSQIANSIERQAAAKRNGE